MKRSGPVAASIVAVLVAIAVLAPWAVPEASIRAVVSGELQALTGRVPSVAGPARLTLFPLPSISVGAISIPGLDGGEPLFEAASAESRLRLLPLLAGRVELADVTVTRARLGLITLADGHRSWAFASGALADAAAGRGESRLPVRAVRLLDSTITYDDRKAGRSATVMVQDAGLRWPAIAGSLTAGGTIGWRGQTLDVAMAIVDAGKLLAGAGSEVTGTATCGVFQASFNGTITGGDGRFEGKVGAIAPSLREALRWLGLPIGEGVGIGSFELNSPAVIDARSLSFPAAELSIDGNSAEGAMVLRLDGPRPKISATLAADSLDLTPYARDFDLAGGDTGQQALPGPASLVPLALVDVDLRISSAETQVGKAKLGRTAMAAVAHDGLVEFSLGEAAAYGGTMTGRVTMASLETPPRMTATLGFEGVEMSGILGDVFGFHKLEGAGTGRIDLSASGASFADLMAGLGGQASFGMADGSMLGVDLVEMMRRIERRPLAIRNEPRGGRTAFDRASATFAVAGGVARTTDARIEGGSLTILLGGAAGIANRSLDLKGEAVLAAPADGTAPFRLPFTVTGDWDQPEVEPDAEALIRRSGAAAPLLMLRAKPMLDHAETVKTTGMPEKSSLAP